MKRPAPARELYTGPFFRQCFAWANAQVADVYILSAKHLVLDPNKIIHPYSVSLRGDANANNVMRHATIKIDRGEWSRKVSRIIKAISKKKNDTDIVYACGAQYCKQLPPGRFPWPMPVRGIGDIKHWLKENTYDH